MARRLIISDVHIGSMHYEPETLIKLLQTEKYDELILAGDIVDFIKVPTFTDRCMNLIKEILKSERVIYITGNHDISFLHWDGLKMSNVEFMNQYNIVVNERKIRIIHGHQLHGRFIEKLGLMRILSILQDRIERTFGFNITRFLRTRVLKQFELKSIKNLLFKNDDIDVLIMGHTHTPEALVWIRPDKQIKTYVNTGDWVSSCTYVTIEDDGEVRLRKFGPTQAEN